MRTCEIQWVLCDLGGTMEKPTWVWSINIKSINAIWMLGNLCCDCERKRWYHDSSLTLLWGRPPSAHTLCDARFNLLQMCQYLEIHSHCSSASTLRGCVSLQYLQSPKMNFTGWIIWCMCGPTYKLLIPKNDVILASIDRRAEAHSFNFFSRCHCDDSSTSEDSPIKCI